MADFILFMHADGRAATATGLWPPYLMKLRELGAFQGGSAIGPGESVRKGTAAGGVTSHIAGYIRVEANSLAEAKALVAGNPVFESGGTVEIRELPRD